MPACDRHQLALSTSWLRESDPTRVLDQIQAAGFARVELEYRLAAAALRSQGLRVGTYLSPHVTGWRERIEIASASPETAEGARAAVLGVWARRVSVSASAVRAPRSLL